MNKIRLIIAREYLTRVKEVLYNNDHFRTGIICTSNFDARSYPEVFRKRDKYDFNY